MTTQVIDACDRCGRRSTRSQIRRAGHKSLPVGWARLTVNVVHENGDRRQNGAYDVCERCVAVLPGLFPGADELVPQDQGADTPEVSLLVPSNQSAVALKVV